MRKPLRPLCASDDEMFREIGDTVVHDVAPHFGIYDERLAEMGL